LATVIPLDRVPERYRQPLCPRGHESSPMAGVLVGRDPSLVWSVCWRCKLIRPRYQLTMQWQPLKQPKGGVDPWL
jgi:hypothetical protein